MSHNREYFLGRAAQARADAFSKAGSEDAEVAGQLALAYAALARSAKVEQETIEVTQIVVPE